MADDPLPRGRRRAAGLLVVTGLMALVGPWLFTPEGLHDVAFLGTPVDGSCAFREATGHPCPSCGLTRSWVWAARGQLGHALRFHAVGTALWLGLLAGGVLGAWRLLRPRPGALAPPWLVASAGGGLFLAWLAQWGLRLTGRLPLP